MPELQAKSRQPRRGIYILPTLFTIGTIFCGFYAIINTMKGEFDLAAMALGFAVVCDGLDGRIARLTNSCSEFGVQMDSLADVITFGLARPCWHTFGVPRRLSQQFHLTRSMCSRLDGLFVSRLSFVAPCGWHALTFRPRSRNHPHPVRRSLLWVCPFRPGLG